MRLHDPTASPLEIAPVIFPKPPSKEPDEATIRSIHVFESLRRHRIIAGLVLLAGVLCSSFILYNRRGPLYEASSQIYISPTSSKALTDDRQQAAPYEGLIDEQIKTITRFDVLQAALRALPANVWQGYGPNELVAISNLQKILGVARMGQGFEVKVSLEGGNARNITDIVNAITTAYIAKSRDVAFYDRDQKLDILHGEEARLQKQLVDKGLQQTSLLQDLGIASVRPEDASPFNDQLAKLHGDLNDATEALGEAQSKLEALRRGGSGAPGMQVAAADAAALDPGMTSLKSTLSAQRGTLIQQMATLTPSNPIYRQDEEQLKTIDSQLAQNAQALQGKNATQITQRLESEIIQKQIVVNRLRAQLLNQTHVATGSAPKYQQAQQLSTDIVDLQKSLSAIGDRIRELQVDSSSPGSVYLSAAAMVPLSPVKSKFALVAMVLLFLNLCGSVVVAVAIDFFDPHIYNADDVKQVMGFAPLGVLLDHDHFSPEVSQQYLLRLAAGIHHAVRASGARTFLFTATEPESGTTTVVEKLAKQLRVLNLQTLTVAATNVDGKISYVATTPPNHDARESVRENKSTSKADSGTEFNRRTGVVPPGESMLTQQPGPVALSTHFADNTQAMFSGSFVAQVLAENESNYDVVLVDGGPLLISADTEYLARIADGTIIVAQSGRTTRKQLERSASLLERLHVPGVAVALNRVDPQHADAALRQDVLDFQSQLQKQRGTGLSKQYPRRIPQERPQPASQHSHDTGSDPTATSGSKQGYQKVSTL